MDKHKNVCAFIPNHKMYNSEDCSSITMINRLTYYQ